MECRFSHAYGVSHSDGIIPPEEFTVYDVRVRNVLGITEKIGNPSNFELLWTRYQDYKAKVIANTPSRLSLREKDQYLWGKSRHDQLIEDIKNGIPPRKKQDGEEDSSDE
jgi:hypothetical protein